MTMRLLRFLAAREGTTAIEFAFVAPIYFFLTLGIMEVGLGGWFSTLVGEGAEQGATYLRQQRLAGNVPTAEGLRGAVCDSLKVGGLSCDAEKLKIGTYYAGVPNSQGNFGVPAIIDNYVDSSGYSKGQYILAVGYNWDLGLSTSKLLFPQGPQGSQIQARTYTVLAERVWDDGARR